MRTHWVMDYETMRSCFVGVFEDVKTDDTRVFVVSKFRNDIVPLLKFLRDNLVNKSWHISYNGLSFDSQITQHILDNAGELAYMNAEDIVSFIYEKAQECIFRSDNGEFQQFGSKNLYIKQVDVFKLNHWDNKAKMSSLKWIQYSMDWANIVDMPLHHSHIIESEEEQEMIIQYCINDVKSTKEIMLRSKEQINLRNALSKEYKLDLYSASEPKISKELFLHFLSQKTGIKKYDLRQMRTIRSLIVVKDILLSSLQFITPQFQQLHNAFKGLSINPMETKKAFEYKLKYKGVETTFALGGLHGAKKSGIYEAKDGMIIMTSDVTSFYPNLAIRNKWSPAHIPKEEFCEQYEWFFEERKKIPKKDPKNYVYKIILNSTYGLSNDANSFLYDPEFTMRITINGQLSLAMLYEMLAENIPGSIPLMQNTDGLEMMIPEKYKDKYLEICANWEKITSLQLEHDQYQKIIIGDVNNYIAVTVDGKSKCKGRFEFEGLALHKNKSHLVIRKALYEYFINGIQPEDYLQMNRNILDYCAGVKIKGAWEFKEHKVENGEHSIIDLQKTIRYFISNKGSKIIKHNKADGREIQLESGKWMQTIFNQIEEKEWDEYDINYKYYLNNIKKELMNIVPHLFESQLNLF